MIINWIDRNDKIAIYNSDMYKTQLFYIHSSILMFTLCLTSCGGGGGDGGSNGSSVACTLPCLKSSPTLSTLTVSSATGKTVTVNFALTADAANIIIFLISTNPLNAASPQYTLGSGYIVNPPGNQPLSIDIVVPAGVNPDSYYPSISITAPQVKSGTNYYIDPTRSSSAYTYADVINGANGSVKLSNFAVPILAVTP